MAKKLVLSEEISSTKSGYESLAKLYHQIIKSQEGIRGIYNRIWHHNEIIIHFNKAKFDVNLASVLGAIFCHVEDEMQCKCNVAGLDLGANKILIRNGFIGETANPIKPSDPHIRYRKFNLNESSNFMKYVIDEVLNKEKFPKHSEGLKREMAKNISEIFANAIHGNCTHVFSCGYLYPSQSQNSRLDFTIVDIGCTFFKNVRACLKLLNTIVSTFKRLVPKVIYVVISTENRIEVRRRQISTSKESSPSCRPTRDISTKQRFLLSVEMTLTEDFWDSFLCNLLIITDPFRGWGKTRNKLSIKT